MQNCEQFAIETHGCAFSMADSGAGDGAGDGAAVVVEEEEEEEEEETDGEAAMIETPPASTPRPHGLQQ